MGKAFTVHSVHHFRSVYCGGVRSVYCVWCLLWAKCLLCTVFIMLQVFYCNWCYKFLLCVVFIVGNMLETFTVGGVGSGKSVYCAQCSSC